MCAARSHSCGAPCSLQVDGKPLCTRKCVADWQVLRNLFEIAQAHLSILVAKNINAIAALWPCLAQFSASFARASVPLEITSMHSKLVPFISAGESSSYLGVLFSNLSFNI